MLEIKENSQAIEFCQYYIGTDKTEIKFNLQMLDIYEDEGDFLINYNTDTRKLLVDEDSNFVVVNINQLVSLSLFQQKTVFEKKYNLAEILRYLDTKQIVSNDSLVYFIREKNEYLEFVMKISVVLSDFNKKQLLDIKLKTLLAIHNRIEQIEIEKFDSNSKKNTKQAEERKKSANTVYTLLVLDPSTISPLQKPIVEEKKKEIPKPKVTFPSAEKAAEEAAMQKPPPEFEFKAKVDCIIS
jgi:hypothetical protein